LCHFPTSVAWLESNRVARYRYDFHSEIKTRERRKPWLPCVHQRIAHTNGCAYPTLFEARYTIRIMKCKGDDANMGYLPADKQAILHPILSSIQLA
jgi:hypothetical protein